MQRESTVHRNILAHMSEGVLSVDRDGRIMTFNPAASRLLGIAEDAALGRTLAEVFLVEEGLDEFNQEIIDAVQSVEVGPPPTAERRTVEARIGGAVRLFTLATSYLRADGAEAETQGQAGARSGGVIAVFADVTEIEELQQTERRLAKMLEAQHTDLQGAYRDLEESSQTLAAALKKVQIARVTATVFVIGLCLLLGTVVWNSQLVPASQTPPRSAATTVAVAKDVDTMIAAPERLVSTIAVAGRLAPRREVQVTSPAAGKVAEAHFQYGEQVVAGQQLVQLDTTEIEREYREAQAAHIGAVKTLAEIEDWANNPEMARVRRDLSKARLALDDQKNKLDQTAFLLEQGIVSTAEYESVERRYQSQLLDYGLLERDQQTVLAKGDADAQEVAHLKLENARIRVQHLEETLRNATVVAPIAGVVLQPPRSDRSQEERLMVKGQVVAQGEHLFTIGDVDGLSVNGWVDEADIDKISLAQRVVVRGDAFPDLELHGAVAHVSRQARRASFSETPTFQFVAALESLAAAERARLRLGMSATVEIVVLDKPEALLVPIYAVQVRGGKAWLRIRDPNDGAVKRRRVEAGATTLTKVEIVRGLRAGDAVVLTGAGRS